MSTTRSYGTSSGTGRLYGRSERPSEHTLWYERSPKAFSGLVSGFGMRRRSQGQRRYPLICYVYPFDECDEEKLLCPPNPPQV